MIERTVAANPEDGEPTQAKIVLYRTDGASVPVSVRYLDKTFWLTQKEIAALFDTTAPNVSMHLKNIFEEGELDESSSMIKFRISEFNRFSGDARPHVDRTGQSVDVIGQREHNMLRLHQTWWER